MPPSALRVTCKTPDATRIPDIFTEAATLLTMLQQRGTLDVLGELVRIRRQGGYCGFDIWLLLLLLIFFTTGAAQGVKGLWENASLIAPSTYAYSDGLTSEPSWPPAMSELLTEDAVLLEQVVDDLLLLAVDPAGEEEQEELEGWQRVHGGSIARQSGPGKLLPNRGGVRRASPG